MLSYFPVLCNPSHKKSPARSVPRVLKLLPIARGFRKFVRKCGLFLKFPKAETDVTGSPSTFFIGTPSARTGKRRIFLNFCIPHAKIQARSAPPFQSRPARAGSAGLSSIFVSPHTKNPRHSRFRGCGNRAVPGNFSPGTGDSRFPSEVVTSSNADYLLVQTPSSVNSYQTPPMVRDSTHI